MSCSHLLLLMEEIFIALKACAVLLGVGNGCYILASERDLVKTTMLPCATWCLCCGQGSGVEVKSW